MAWPLHVDEDDNSPEATEENISSSTDNINEAANNYAQGAAGISLLNPQNLADTRAPNPYIERIRNVRRYSLGDIPQSYAQLVSGPNDINFGQRHSIPQNGNGRRYSLDEAGRSNTQRASGSSINQRHSHPCCHVNPAMLHSCCLDVERRRSLESLNLHRRHSLPQNHFPDSYNPDVTFNSTISRTILNPHVQFPAYDSQTSAFSINAEYERQRSFNISHSLLFGNENFQADRYVQQAVSDAGPEFFMRFLADEMEQRGLKLPEDMCRQMSQSGEMPQSFIYLIDRFSTSLEREMIFCLALRVEFPLSLNCFVAIVDGMSNGTTSPERIVTLFFFCADLAIRALREGNATLFREIVLWTQWYLRRHDTVIVVPSKRPSYKIAATACLVGIIAILCLMKRN